MKIFSMETSLSSSQKPNKFALQPIKACKTFEHFQLGILISSINLTSERKNQFQSNVSMRYLKLIHFLIFDSAVICRVMHF